MSAAIMALPFVAAAGGMSWSASKRAAKAAAKAAKENAARLRWNADEVEKTADINNLAFLFNIDANKVATDFNVAQIKQEEAHVRWQTAHNETLARRAKRRMQGSQLVAATASGVDARASSSYDVMRDSEMEMEAQIQGEVYSGLRQANKLFSQAEITRVQGENKAWNLEFQRTENLRMSRLEAEDTRWRAKVVEMGGQAQASSLKSQGTATLLNTAISAYSMYAGSSAGATTGTS